LSTAAAAKDLRSLTEEIAAQEAELRQGGGRRGQERQRELGRLTARERVERLLDDPCDFLEIGLWAGWEMYPDVGPVPAAGVLCGVGLIQNRACMVVANDATVKAGAFFPQTVKKVLRAQRIAHQCGLPLVYLVDSAGAYLPMQDEIFPDEDDFGRIFRNNSVISAAGIPQYSAIMGNCVAGGAYLPVLSDTLLMTEGSGLYLAGPALVRAAIGQVADAEELGGARMHAEISGTVDYYEKDDESCLAHLRELIGHLPLEGPSGYALGAGDASARPESDPESVYSLLNPATRAEFDVRDVLRTIVDAGSFDEFKADYGKTLVCGLCRIGGRPAGVVASQRKRVHSARGELQIGGVIYHDSADKAARFVLECNQSALPILFFQDVTGFMVGRDSEQAGIIRSGAKLVNAISNSVVPKITVIIGGSFGAGNYALCGKAFDPRFIFAWPNAQYAVMGGAQAAATLVQVQEQTARKAGKPLSAEDLAELRRTIQADYDRTTDIRYGAARGWVDAIIAPHETRRVLERTLAIVSRKRETSAFRTGVFQV
jgi:acetyl-CoA carboxylase carboxyltransferase component